MALQVRNKNGVPKLVGYTNMTRESMNVELYKSGWTKVGSGAFSVVFENRVFPEHVIKVFGDSAYMTYAKSIEGKRCIHLPKIEKIYKLREGKYCAVAVMEKLQSKNTPVGILSYIRHPHKSDKKVEKKFPKLKTARRHIHKILSEKRYSLDLHGANLMWRKEIPVITDPFVY